MTSLLFCMLATVLEYIRKAKNLIISLIFVVAILKIIGSIVMINWNVQDKA